MSAEAEPLLALCGVEIAYPGRGWLAALGRREPAASVRDISFDLVRGETLALVGESGSGKSTIARAISGLVTARKGTIRFGGRDINIPIERRSQDLKRDIQIVFQNPDASLNPRHSVGFILSRAIRAFHRLDSATVRSKVDALLADVRLSGDYASRYPRQLSGGERQRVAIARALAAQPKVLVCDEILSALDVSVQAEIIELLRSLQRDQGIAILFISHDLAVVRWLADRVAVLRHGALCEIGATEDVYAPPFHPYTKQLLDAVPHMGRQTA
ncbi:hypothetical protein K32_09310 [Kaistia sp. 32K]|uniref:ABC transporter ATP-binding protein n=1 Tax=Kaistia sp. 32K TaxID=2795690 RepID=UPI0019166CA2|nr:ATP-binding cassette domain-containing protein [Kaistia sp. 32K]BCP52314.1 hypothetical protein K32_09310 [Kaistia sp. 32K]